MPSIDLGGSENYRFAVFARGFHRASNDYPRRRRRKLLYSKSYKVRMRLANRIRTFLLYHQDNPKATRYTGFIECAETLDEYFRNPTDFNWNSAAHALTRFENKLALSRWSNITTSEWERLDHYFEQELNPYEDY